MGPERQEALFAAFDKGKSARHFSKVPGAGARGTVNSLYGRLRGKLAELQGIHSLSSGVFGASAPPHRWVRKEARRYGKRGRTRELVRPTPSSTPQARRFVGLRLRIVNGAVTVGSVTAADISKLQKKIEGQLPHGRRPCELLLDGARQNQALAYLEVRGGKLGQRVIVPAGALIVSWRLPNQAWLKQFWPMALAWLEEYRSIPLENLSLYFAEMVWRFNRKYLKPGLPAARDLV